jgi:Ca-activated chloride channel family protein|tara:strand:- start:15510 stop:16499 length:990 start_codon:yes stop_codon:yes gene_type:complete
MEFANPWFLLFGILVPIIFWWYFNRGYRNEGTIQFSTIQNFQKIKQLSGTNKVRLLFFFRLVVITLLLIALARPRAILDMKESFRDVVDIVIVLDISGSMKAEDFKPNRLEAAKEEAQEFIKNRDDDRIGLLIFAGESYIQCPSTVDHQVLSNLLSQVAIIDEEHDGTAIGMAIAHCVNRLRKSDAESKVMILLSDGSNNKGELDPLTSAGFAKDYGIKIYTIGVGKRGKAPYPVDDPFFGKRYVQVDVDMDEETLRDVAEKTGGQYFRATNEEQLTKIYEEIDQLERSEIEVTEYTEYSELYAWFLIPALCFGFLEHLLKVIIFRVRT